MDQKPADVLVTIVPEILAVLRCPVSGEKLRATDDGRWLVSDAAGVRYPVIDGVARLIAPAAEKLEEQK